MHKICILMLWAILPTITHTEPATPQTERALIIYKIQMGDTLSQLSKKYLRQPADLETIRDLNQLRSIDLLPTGELLKIPRHAVKQSPSQATIISLSCGRPIRAGTPLRPMSIGSVLNEGAIIDIPAECYASLLLEDSSIIRLPSSAAIKISILRKNALEASPEVQLDLAKGRIELEVYKGRSQSTPFEVRTPISITGVRGTEFRVGYAPTEQSGQVEVIDGAVRAMGINDSNFQSVNKGQGLPFDSSGKSLPIEKLISPPAFERAILTNKNQAIYTIKLASRTQAQNYLAIRSKSANFLSDQLSQVIKVPEINSTSLSQDTVFFQFSSVSQSGLVGSPRQYGFCVIQNDARSSRCRATFDAPMTENVMIAFSLTRHSQGSPQELVATKKLQSRNGQFTIEGLPSGHYTWTMAYTTLQNNTASTSRQSGSFDLIAITSPAP